MSQIKVSVVVPIYNNEIYLRECLDSLVNQTLKDIEVICVNDGSTDSCPAIIREYTKKDSRFKMIDKPNGGYGHTMNRGFEMAQGEYIGILESDDFAETSMYEKLYNAAKKNNCDVVKSDFCRFENGKNGIIKTYVPLTNDNEWYSRVIDPKKEPQALRLKMNTWTGIYRREFILKNGITHHETPGASYQDNGFFFKTMTQAERIMFVHEAFYMNRRDNPNSSVYDKGKVYAMNKEMAYIEDFLKSKDGLWAAFKDVFFFKMLSNYEFTYKRIAEERREEYLLTISAEFKTAFENGDLVFENSFSKLESQRVRLIIESPLSYPLFDKIIALEAQNKSLKSEIAAIKNSKSFKVGRMLTNPLRSIRNKIKR